MTKRDDGGPAFPRMDELLPGLSKSGMSLRDWIAGQALNGLLSFARSGEPGVYYDAPSDRGITPPDNRIFVPEHNAALWATSAYRLADAMLAEREKDRGDSK